MLNSQPDQLVIRVQEEQQLINPQAYNPSLWEAPKVLDGYDSQAEFFCTRCQQKRLSIVKSVAGTGTFACCCCLCVLTVVLGLLPFYVADCQDKVHICQVCSTYVGYKEFKPC